MERQRFSSFLHGFLTTKRLVVIVLAAAVLYVLVFWSVQTFKEFHQRPHLEEWRNMSRLSTDSTLFWCHGLKFANPVSSYCHFQWLFVDPTGELVFKASERGSYGINEAADIGRVRNGRFVSLEAFEKPFIASYAIYGMSSTVSNRHLVNFSVKMELEFDFEVVDTLAVIISIPDHITLQTMVLDVMIGVATLLDRFNVPVDDEVIIVADQRCENDLQELLSLLGRVVPVRHGVVYKHALIGMGPFGFSADIVKKKISNGDHGGQESYEIMRARVGLQPRSVWSGSGKVRTGIISCGNNVEMFVKVGETLGKFAWVEVSKIDSFEDVLSIDVVFADCKCDVAALAAFLPYNSALVAVGNKDIDFFEFEYTYQDMPHLRTFKHIFETSGKLLEMFNFVLTRILGDKILSDEVWEDSAATDVSSFMKPSNTSNFKCMGLFGREGLDVVKSAAHSSCHFERVCVEGLQIYAIQNSVSSRSNLSVGLIKDLLSVPVFQDRIPIMDLGMPYFEGSYPWRYIPPVKWERSLKESDFLTASVVMFTDVHFDNLGHTQLHNMYPNELLARIYGMPEDDVDMYRGSHSDHDSPRHPALEKMIQGWPQVLTKSDSFYEPGDKKCFKDLFVGTGGMAMLYGHPFYHGYDKNAKFYNGVGRLGGADFVRRRIYRKLGLKELPPSSTNLNVLIAHKSSPSRHGGNLFDVDAAIVRLTEISPQHNFAHCTFADVTLAEAIELLSKVDVLVGAYGAVGYNALFLRPGSTVALLPAYFDCKLESTAVRASHAIFDYVGQIRHYRYTPGIDMFERGTPHPGDSVCGARIDVEIVSRVIKDHVFFVNSWKWF